METHAQTDTTDCSTLPANAVGSNTQNCTQTTFNSSTNAYSVFACPVVNNVRDIFIPWEQMARGKTRDSKWLQVTCAVCGNHMVSGRFPPGHLPPLRLGLGLWTVMSRNAILGHVARLPDNTSVRQLKGHTCTMKLSMSKQRTSLDVRKFAFSQRVVQEWNKLSQDVVDATSVNEFKNRLDKFWFGGAHKLPPSGWPPNVFWCILGIKKFAPF